MPTTIVLSIFSAMILAQLFGQAWCIRLGARWIRIGRLRYGRALLISLALQLVGIAAAAGSLAVPISDILALAIMLGATWLLLSALLRTSFGKAILVWLATWIVTLPMVLFALLVLRPYVMEAFITPTGSMMPTLLGPHQRLACPVCGAPAYQMVSEHPQWLANKVPTICQKFHMTQSAAATGELRGSDRFLCLKFLAPRRWDIIVYRPPDRPQIRYVCRVAGLPGEQIEIRNGALWINGREEPPPPSLKGIVYNLPPLLGQQSAAACDGPVPLGPDEFFVLGDFSELSYDSRLRTDGAPGHHRYAIPRDSIEGVVSHVYWPPSRLAVLR